MKPSSLYYLPAMTSSKSLELVGDLHKIPVGEHFDEAAPDYETVWSAICDFLDQATQV